MSGKYFGKVSWNLTDSYVDENSPDNGIEFVIIWLRSEKIITGLTFLNKMWRNFQKD